MKYWRVTNLLSGITAIYKAKTESGALDSMARAAGYRSYTAMKGDVPGSRFRVMEISAALALQSLSRSRRKLSDSEISRKARVEFKRALGSGLDIAAAEAAAIELVSELADSPGEFDQTTLTWVSRSRRKR